MYVKLVLRLISNWRYASFKAIQSIIITFINDSYYKNNELLLLITI